MKKIQLGKSGLKVPAIAVGCMRMSQADPEKLPAFIESCLEYGANFFDHADIYGNGECETLFAQAIGMKPSVREKVLLQSKCGIVPGVMYDFSKEHILDSVDGILKRLNTDYLDVLLLHRPDALMEPEEVAEAFDRLETSGKVRHFGVSNQRPYQIQLLQKYIRQPLVVDQLQFSMTNSQMVTQGMEVNMATDGAVDRDGGILDYCRLNDITIQAWSPFQYGFFSGVFLGNEKFPELNQAIGKLAEKYQVSDTAIVTAWMMRHPAGMQMVTGTMNAGRMKEICQGTDILLTRQEWYELYLAAGHMLP
ncbi:MAG TPA: aldo/keto reductase [Candidatus Onthocola gallistercoris]|uniref:Aldo/keto reductase n=1 Tax=Candidatus Onthocola gallistercoris TaxID=2840876 RepID=A0A9D1HF50_9FIRM|nr:aldo/keto reductase [Candidatus Onthocola gallistercoris]